MKKLRALSVLIALILIMSVGIVSVSAVRAPVTFGNVNLQDGIEVTDATLIQRCVAKLQEIDDYASFAADVDNDGEVTVVDATMIQQYLAGFINGFPAGVGSFVDVYAEALISDYSSGNARVGTPVTFTAIASGHAGPLKYQFYINDEVVQPYSEKSTYTHTFEKAGDYKIEFYVTNKAGITLNESIYFTVTDPLDIGSLNITSIHHRGFYDYFLTFEANVELEVAPCEYEFCLAKITDEEPIYGEVVETQDYSEKNTFTLSKGLDDYCDYILYVTVRDANGHTDYDTLTFTYITPPPA